MAMNPGGATHSKVARGAPLPGFAPALATENVSVKSRAFPIWLLLTAILLIPASLNIHLSGDGLKFTPGRAAIALLLLPGLLTLSRAPRRVVASDVFVFLTAVWMIGSRIPEDGLNPSAVASVIELFGGYVLGRVKLVDYDLLNILRLIVLVPSRLAARNTLARCQSRRAFHMG